MLLSRDTADTRWRSAPAKRVIEYAPEDLKHKLSVALRPEYVIEDEYGTGGYGGDEGYFEPEQIAVPVQAGWAYDREMKDAKELAHAGTLSGVTAGLSLGCALLLSGSRLGTVVGISAAGLGVLSGIFFGGSWKASQNAAMVEKYARNVA